MNKFTKKFTKKLYKMCKKGKVELTIYEETTTFCEVPTGRYILHGIRNKFVFEFKISSKYIKIVQPYEKDTELKLSPKMYHKFRLMYKKHLDIFVKDEQKALEKKLIKILKGD